MSAKWIKSKRHFQQLLNKTPIKWRRLMPIDDDIFPAYVIYVGRIPVALINENYVKNIIIDYMDYMGTSVLIR